MGGLSCTIQWTAALCQHKDYFVGRMGARLGNEQAESCVQLGKGTRRSKDDVDCILGYNLVFAAYWQQSMYEL